MMMFHSIQAVLYSLAQAEVWFEWVFVRPSSNKSCNRALSELRVKDLIYFMHFLEKNSRGKVDVCVWGTESSKLLCCFCFKLSSQGCTGEMESLGQRTWEHFVVVGGGG